MQRRVEVERTGASVGWGWVVLAALSPLPGVGIALAGVAVPDPVRALWYGVAIVGAAFLLSWATEVAQLDFS